MFSPIKTYNVFSPTIEKAAAFIDRKTLRRKGKRAGCIISIEETDINNVRLGQPTYYLTYKIEPPTSSAQTVWDRAVLDYSCYSNWNTVDTGV